jgi:hypothetical protein
MKTVIVESESHSAWSRISHSLKSIRDWWERSNKPYSLVFCLSLLLAVGLIVTTGH